MANDANGQWMGLGVGDVDNPDTPRDAPNWNAIRLLTAKLHDKYQWARDLGVVAQPNYDELVARAVEQFCQRTGLPISRDPNGRVVANLAVRQRLGSYPAPGADDRVRSGSARVLPIMFTVEGHKSDMFYGPVADTATQLEGEGLCRHQPIGYHNAAFPFDNASGENELARLVGATVMDNGVPFPAGTKWVLGIFSQGAIVGFDFWMDHLAPGKPLEWREADLLGVLAYGNPCRQTDSIAPWATGWLKKTGTHGLDPYRRFGLPGFPVKPDNWMDVYREGDIFAENGDNDASKAKAAVYQAVARGDFFSDPMSLAFQISTLFSRPEREIYAIIEAIISGVVFLKDKPNPHYSPYDISGGVSWVRSLLTGRPAVPAPATPATA
ncbi:peptidoglycan-binding protein [Mycobacterium camsae]|uniref:peptidoglycan-binding protein n=1 Tax=Mycobacterium gordonae TaxID=1778 RepID=UPI00197D3A3F|nr:peptidoglycan-binding protein [Mycobacterium gordonae]